MTLLEIAHQYSSMSASGISFKCFSHSRNITLLNRDMGHFFCLISQTWQKLIRLDPKNAKEVSFAIFYIYFIVKTLWGGVPAKG